MLKTVSKLTVIILAIILTSCKDDSGILDNLFSGETESVSISDLPSAVVDAVNQALPGQEITDATMITASDGSVLFSVETDGDSSMTCNKVGKSITEINAEDLPQSIIDYLSTEYAESIILRAGQAENKDGELRYVVNLSSGEVLAFDESGELVATRMRGKGKRGHNGRGKHGSFELVAEADLLQAITDYLSTNHASETIEKAFSVETKDGTKVYGVKLDGLQVLFFDESGAFLEDFKPRWNK